MARTARHTRMRDVVSIQRPTSNSQDQFGGISQDGYTEVASIRCSATQFSGDTNFRDYNKDITEQDWQLLVRKKSLPSLVGDEIFVLETPALTLKLTSKVEQDIRTFRLRMTAID